MNGNIGTLCKSGEFFIKIQNKHVPLKKKKIGPNNSPCMTNALQKTIIKLTHLQKLCFKSKAQKDYA